MPGVTASPSSGSTSTTTTPTATSPPAAPSSVSLANGGGAGGDYVDTGNVNSLSVDVALPSTSLPTDKVDLTVSDGNPDHDQTARLFGTSGSGILHFTGINGQALSDGPITVTVTATNDYGTSDPTTTTVTKDTGAPAPPTSIALANPQGSSNAVNASTASAVSVSIGLDATSQSTDTVNVTLTNGADSTNAYTAAATTGLGTVTVTGIDAGSLTDGTVTATATSVDQAGNASSAQTATFPKDTVLPTATIVRVGSSSTNASSVQWAITLSDPATISDANFTLVSTGLGGAPTITSVIGSGTSYTVVAGTGTGSGSLGLNLKPNSVQDAAGNAATSVTGPVFTVDRAAPTITPSCPVGGGSYKTNGNGNGTWSKSCNNQLSGSAADTGGSGVGSVTVSVQQGAVSTACWSGSAFTAACPKKLTTTLSAGTWTLALAQASLSAGKTYNVIVDATDAAGNTTTKTFSFTTT
jgi:hypothetical protein